MSDITYRSLVQLDKIYRTYQDSIDLGVPPKARYAVKWFLWSFLIVALAAHIATMADVHSVMVPMAPFLIAVMVGACRYVTFPHKTWDGLLGSMLNVYAPSDETAFLRFEACVGLHGFVDVDVIDWVCAERISLENAEHAERARAVVDRIVND